MIHESAQDQSRRFHDTYYVGGVDLRAEGTDISTVINSFHALPEVVTEAPVPAAVPPETALPNSKEAEKNENAAFKAMMREVADRHEARSHIFGHNIIKHTQSPRVIDYAGDFGKQNQLPLETNPARKVVPISQGRAIRARRFHESKIMRSRTL